MGCRAKSLYNIFMLLCNLALCLVVFACDGNRHLIGEQELIIGVRADDYIIEPYKSRLGMYPLNVNVCEPLVRLTADFQIEPMLATRWEYRGNNTWRFFLRAGVVFSNGQPLTSEAVRWTFARLAKREAQHTFLTEDSVKIIDDLTVDITPSRPNMRLLEQLVHPNYSIIAPNTEPVTELIGTGPFKLVEYKRGQWIKVERNEHYWGERARLRRITFRFLPDDTTRVLTLQAGEVGMIFDVPREQVDGLRAQAGMQVVTAPVGRVAAIFLNIYGQPPRDLLADRNIRHAIAMAIDRRALIEKVWEGNGELIATICPTSILGDHAQVVRGFDYSPVKAAALLAQQGWVRGADGVLARAGRRLELTIIAWPEFDPSALEFLQAQLAALGIELHIAKLADMASYQSRIDAGDFDLDLEAGNQNDANPIFLPALLFYSKAPSKSVRYFAPGGHYDEIVKAGLEAVERDEVRRLSAEAMHILNDEEAIVIPLSGLRRIYAMSDRVRGFTPHPSQLNQRWDTLFIKQ